MRGNCKIATGISPEYGGISRASLSNW